MSATWILILLVSLMGFALHYEFARLHRELRRASHYLERISEQLEDWIASRDEETDGEE